MHIINMTDCRSERVVDLEIAVRETTFHKGILMEFQPVWRLPDSKGYCRDNSMILISDTLRGTWIFPQPRQWRK
jgi:hypothetical protein